MRADEALEPGPDRRPFDGDAIERIWTVENDHRQPAFCRSFEAKEHRRLKRVVPTADVWQVDHQHIQFAQMLKLGTEALDRITVQAVDRAAMTWMNCVRDADQVLCFRSESVLRTEQGGETDVPRFSEQIRNVTEARIYARRVCYKPDPAAPERLEALAN